MWGTGTQNTFFSLYEHRTRCEVTGTQCRRGDKTFFSLDVPQWLVMAMLDHTLEKVTLLAKRSISLSLEFFSCRMEMILNYIKFLLL